MIVRSLRETLLPCALLLAFAGCCCPWSRDLSRPVITKPRLALHISGIWHQATDDLETLLREFETDSSVASRHPCNARAAASLSEKAYAIAEALHCDCDDRAVDYWARTIAWADEAMSFCPTTCASRLPWIRHSAESRIFSHAQAYGRLIPSSHLLINGNAHSIHVPVAHHGFVWQSSDFDRLRVFEPPDAPGNVAGRGVPLVVFTPGQSPDAARRSWCGRSCDARSCCERIFGTEEPPQRCRNEQDFSFLVPGTPFAATGVITLPVSLFTETATIAHASDHSLQEPSVIFYNPLVLPVEGDHARIAQSPGMPLAFIQQNSQYDPLRVFLNGDAGVNEARLRFFEPFQSDKIPLVFVHGLISDPTTFVEMADAIRADPVLRNRYQIWAFRYPTGEPFLKSAATLRRQLAAAFALREPCESDEHSTGGPEPCQRAVIVGHSMGGLVAKMQITDSNDDLWRSVANVPFEQLRGPPERLAELHESFFFTANPNVGRVVYIATPHRGSPWAARCIGRLGGLLARRRLPDERAYNEVAALNPNAFSGEFGDSFPSSVELLRPSSRLLQSLASLPSSPQTTVHSIIGDHCRLPLAGRSDGVVPVDSAYVPEAQTTAVVDASHTSIQHSIDAQQELLRILRQHLDEISF